MTGISYSRIVSAVPNRLTVIGNDGQTYTITGSRNNRNNNPGNIAANSAVALANGQIGVDSSFAGHTPMAVFPTEAAGQAAQAQSVVGRYGNDTIARMASHYAPAGPPDYNDPVSYARTLANAAGVPPNTRINDLTPTQQAAMLRAQAQLEGGQAATAYDSQGNVVLTPPVDIPGNDAPFPLDAPAGYGINAPGSPDDRDAAEQAALTSPFDFDSTAAATGYGWAPPAGATSGPFNYDGTAAAQPTMTTPNGNSYVVGQTYHTADGAAYRANSDGSFTKIADQPRSPTPIQLYFESQGAQAQQNLANEANTVKNAAQTAGSFLGNLWNSLGSSGPSAPTPSLVAPNSSGSPDDRSSTPFPSLPDPYTAGGGPFSYGGGYNDVTDAQQTALDALPAQHPATVGDRAAQLNAATGSGWADSYYTGGPFDYPASSSSGDATPDHGADEGPTYTTKVVETQVANPAYQKWLDDQNSAIYGVSGVESPSLDADGNVTLPSGYLGAKVPAPPKTIAKQTTIKVPTYTPKQDVAQLSKPIVMPIAAPNGYTYLPNGSGGYTRVGVVNPSLTNAQRDALAAAPALNSQPNGDPFGSRAGVSTSGFNTQTGGQGGQNASAARNQSAGGSLTGSQW